MSLTGDAGDEQALEEILSVGTSAGGARAKAIVAWSPETDQIRSGHLPLAPGFEHWLLKFDGVEARDEGLGEPQGYGAVELAYSTMARAAGITMPPTRLLEENGRRHFMTRRFDRGPSGPPGWRVGAPTRSLTRSLRRWPAGRSSPRRRKSTSGARS